MGPWFSSLCIISLLSLLRIRRIRRMVVLNECGACGYSLAGLLRDASCPECNSARRVRAVTHRRTLVFVRFGRLPLVLAVYLLTPPLWAVANLLGTTCRYAAVEGFAAGWRNASVGVGEQYDKFGWLFEEFAPSCAAIAAAAMVWPRSARWWIAVGLVLWLVWLSWNSVSAWHRHLNHDAPNALVLCVAASLLVIRALVRYQTGVIARLRTEGPR